VTADFDVTAPFVLADNVKFTAVGELTEHDRNQLDADEDGVVLSFANSRARSKVLDLKTASLLEQFRSPRTIVESVIRFCGESGDDPEQVLESAFSVIEQFIVENVLVTDGFVGDSTEPVVGESEWNGLGIIRMLQCYDDTEIHQAHRGSSMVALKIARPGSRVAVPALDREAAILTHLDGSVAPRLLDSGTHDGLRYLEVEWCDGIDGARAAAAMRALPDRLTWTALLAFVRNIAATYADLHRRGVVHSDVHPRNLVVARDGAVQLLDFGAALCPKDVDEGLPKAPRVTVGWFFEPENARARVAGDGALIATPLGEQHVVAHLIYSFVTGHGYRAFSAERDAAYREVATAEPEPFTRWGLPAWPDLERVLARGLASEPGDRFEDMTAFAAALDAVGEPPADTRGSPARGAEGGIERDLVDDYVRRLDPDRPLFASPFPEVPRCSVTFGSAGAAYFLYRLPDSGRARSCLAGRSCGQRRPLRTPRSAETTPSTFPRMA